MPPEQAEARHERMGPASDVYSIGAILYELLAGKPPFRSDSFLETLRQIREEVPSPISQFNPRVPRALEAICLKCLHKKPGKRYQSAEELARELQMFLDDESPQPVANILVKADEITMVLRFRWRNCSCCSGCYGLLVLGQL